MDINCDGGYRFDLVIDTLTEAIQCSICALLLRDAIELPCTHSFCKSCWKRWQRLKTAQFQPTTCPLCNKTYDRDVEHTSGALNRFITTFLDIYCLQSKEGCEWVGKILDYQEHEKDHCIFVDAKCSFEGCNINVKRKDLEKHEQECQYRLIQCEWCEKEHPVIHMQDHYKECPSYPVQCPNEGCMEEFKREEIDMHMKEACPYQEVCCEFQTSGCDQKFKRRELEDHLQDFIQKHMSLIMKEMTALKQEAETKEKRLIAVENELAVSRKRERELERRLKERDQYDKAGIIELQFQSSRSKKKKVLKYY